MAKFITVHWNASSSVPITINIDQIVGIYDSGVATPSGMANIQLPVLGSVVTDESVQDVLDLINAAYEVA